MLPRGNSEVTKPRKSAYLHAPVHKEGVRYTGRYSVEFDGELIVQDSPDPEHDLARALLARGITGEVTVIDAKTLTPRTIVQIEEAAGLSVEEGPSGPRSIKWRETRVDRLPTAEEDLVLPTTPEDVAA